MSRRSTPTKFRRQAQAVRRENLADASGGGGDPEPTEIRRHSRAGLYAVAVVNAAWIVALMTLAILTANPVTFNREQIGRADFVVTVSVDNADGNRFAVEKEWKRGAELGTVTITNFPDAQGKQTGQLIVPLSVGRDGVMRVTPTRLPNRAPLVYPLSAETAGRLKRVLERLARSSDNAKLPTDGRIGQSSNSM